MGWLSQAADVAQPASFSNRMRSRRFARFSALAEGLGRPLRVLDIGGTNLFWERRGWAGIPEVRIVTVNLRAEERRHENIEPAVGDATNLHAYHDNSFDVVFSNSVIEHLFTWENQRAMAREVQRVARAYWVQTPNFWFPVEPHFHVPGWQWLPRRVRVAIIRRVRCGQRGPYPDPREARDRVDEVRLLTGRDMQQLFPNGTVWAERFGGLVKSWVAYGGFDSTQSRDVARISGTEKHGDPRSAY